MIVLSFALESTMIGLRRYYHSPPQLSVFLGIVVFAQYFFLKNFAVSKILVIFASDQACPWGQGGSRHRWNLEAGESHL